MVKASGVAAPAASGSRGTEHGRAYAFGWGCFLAIVALTPLIIGVLPPVLGPLSAFRAFDAVDLPKAVTVLVLAGASLGALCVGALRGEVELRWHPVLWVVLALVAWAGVSAAFSASPIVSVWGAYNSNEGLIAIFGYGLVAFLAMQFVRSARALRTVAIIAVAAAALVSAYAVLQFTGFDPLVWVGDVGRVFSTMGNPDLLGTYLVFPLTLAAGLALSSPRGRASLGWWAAAALIAAALLATATRGAWIGALAAGLSIWLAGWGGVWKASRGRKFAIAGGAIVVVAGVAAGVVAIRPKLAASSTTLAGVLASLSNGRTVIWLTGLRAWLTHPIAGWGPDGFARAFQSAVGADWYALVEGLQGVQNAHGLPVQVLVTLGVVGLALMGWALARTAAVSLRTVRAVTGRGRLLFVCAWGSFIGLIVALLFGVTTPGVSVWLWLTAGLLLAPGSRPVRVHAKPTLAAGAVLGVALALWTGSWFVADVVVGRAMVLAPGPAQVAALREAVTLDPLAPNYRWLVADAIVNEAVAGQKAGENAQAVDSTILTSFPAYGAALSADPGDALVRTAFANVLVAYAARHPGGTEVQQAVDVATEAVALAPRNPAALAALARAYDVSGRRTEAEATARLAREVAPAYAAQTLGTLGLGGASAP